MRAPPYALTGSRFVFDRSGRRLLVVQPDAIAIASTGDVATIRLPLPDALGVAAFDDQLWVATGESELVRFDASGAPLGEPIALPLAPAAILAPAPCGPAAAVWTADAPLVLTDDHGVLGAVEHARGQLALPLTGKRVALASGARVTLPNGRALQLDAPICGGAFLADGKSLVVVTGAAANRELRVIALASAQIVFRHAIALDVRIALGRALALVRRDARVLSAIDLRTGRELGTVACEHDLVDHAVDADGRWLATYGAGGELALHELSAVLRTPLAKPLSLPAMSPPSTASASANAPTTNPSTNASTPTSEVIVRSPSTRDAIGAFACRVEDVDVAVASARKAAASWAVLDLEARIEVVGRLEREIVKRAPDLLVVMGRELARPPWECKRELAGLIPRLADILANARDELADVRRHAATMVRRPHGVIAVVTPVMLPVATAHAQIVAALVAGNTVVWKPSPLAACSAQAYADMARAAGFPTGIFTIVHGQADVGARLLAHPGVDHGVFVGSRESARDVRRAHAERDRQTIAIHAGSKNPAVVVRGADLTRAADDIAEVAWLTAGQRATAIGRVLVEREWVDAFAAALAAAARRLAAEPGYLVPLFSPDRYDRYFERIHAAVACGAQPIVRPESRPDSLYVGPSIHVVEDASRAAAYLDTELFGPDVAIEPVPDLSDALARLDGHAANFATLYTEDAEAWRRFAARVDAGALLWNHAPTAVSGRLAFAARGAAERGPSVLAMTRRIACCAAATGCVPDRASAATTTRAQASAS